MVETDVIYFNMVSLIVSFTGGGVISALINWTRANRADKKDREIRLLLLENNFRHIDYA